MSRERQLSIWTALGLWAAAVAGAAVFGVRLGYSGRAFAVTLSVLALFLAIQLSLAAGNLGERFARRAGSHFGVLFAIVPFLAYLIYLAGTHSFTWSRAALAAGYTLTPVLLTMSAGRATAGAWQDYVAMLAIFLPLKMRFLHVLWPYGGATIGYIATMLLAMSVALATFLFVRQFDGVGYNIVWGRDAMLAVLFHFGLLAVIVIPLGTALHFIRFDPAQAHWRSLPADAISIFLLTAWPEELLFRGLLQNSLSRTFSSEAGGWFAASAVFGLAHITNNGVFPNWRYATLATIAGMFYGRTWRETNSIFTSAIVHALVDTIWHLMFRTLS
ncbi:MAG TPA: CPBP family intramembrane glutamic endopeptidase [Candidatus Acidoferrales bacterium]|jgi:membrane protease YdiL (CAAX protease family)|nr:CPBP family intramembrane glutamic endopeptidase [Candidatus Acidoferrales bacterium]